MIQTYLNKTFHVNSLFMHSFFFLGFFSPQFTVGMFGVCFFRRSVHASLSASAPVESVVFNKSGWRRDATACKCFTQNPQIHLLLTNVTGVPSLLCNK